MENDAQDDLSRRWKSEADTVVIGGGIAGCSVAYHLAKMVGSKLFFVTGLVIFITAVARLDCPDLLG